MAEGSAPFSPVAVGTPLPIVGLGGALSEEGYFHPANGRAVARNLADCHVPACADVPRITLDVLDIPDPAMGDLCARGFAEIGTNNTPAAIGSALVKVRISADLYLASGKVIGACGSTTKPHGSARRRRSLAELEHGVREEVGRFLRQVVADALQHRLSPQPGEMRRGLRGVGRRIDAVVGAFQHDRDGASAGGARIA